MRPIKFRGRCIDNHLPDTGKMVVGCYFSGVYPKGEIHAIIDRDGDEFDVEPESVKQLVGYDADGNEVYEDDELVNEQGDTFIALLCEAVLTDEGFIHTVPLECLKLKEEPKP